MVCKIQAVVGCILLLVTILPTVTSADDAAPSEEKYKILFLIPFGLNSHRNVMLPIAGGLAERGHNVSILSALPPTNRYSKVLEIQHDVQLIKGELRNMFDRRRYPTSTFMGFANVLPKMAEKFYHDPIVQRLYQERHTFHLVVIDELFNEFAYPFVYQKPFIFTEAIGINPTTSSILGNVLNPSYFPSLTEDYNRPYSLWNRLQNLYRHLHFPFNWRYYYVVPAVQKEISKQFPDIPPLLDIEKNVSLILTQSHILTAVPVPLLPSQIPIGGHICRKPEPLTRELKEVVERSSSGVIYFSLGSVTPGEALPEQYRDIMVEAFRLIPQTVVWKYERSIPDLSDNVYLSPWVPQQDLIGHHNVKLFITHGGLLSYIEGLCHGTPFLALPIVGDQLKNSVSITTKGYGKSLVWEDLSVELLNYTIRELIDNPSYASEIRKASLVMEDQPESPLQRAIWWTEYVARHKGAPHLRSPGATTPWIEYLMLDVLLLLHVVAFICYWSFKKLVTFCLRGSIGFGQSKTPGEREVKLKRA